MSLNSLDSDKLYFNWTKFLHESSVDVFLVGVWRVEFRTDDIDMRLSVDVAAAWSHVTLI